jgi:protein-disulfide isomerase
MNSGRQILVAAVVVGVAILGAGLVLARSVDRMTAQLDVTTEKLEGIRAQIEGAGDSLAAARAPAPARPGRPDPNRRYTVNVEGAPSLGPASAPVTLVEFSDFQCPFCSRVGPTLKQIRETYGDQVRLVFKHLPLDMHRDAPGAHAAAEAAGRQDKFWEMHDKIFENQRELNAEKYKQYATELGLDVAQFEKDVASSEVKARVDADKREAASLGATGTPSFFINGRYLSGARPFEAFKEIIDAELEAKGDA